MSVKVVKEIPRFQFQDFLLEDVHPEGVTSISHDRLMHSWKEENI